MPKKVKPRAKRKARVWYLVMGQGVPDPFACNHRRWLMEPDRKYADKCFPEFAPHTVVRVVECPERKRKLK